MWNSQVDVKATGSGLKGIVALITGAGSPIGLGEANAIKLAPMEINVNGILPGMASDIAGQNINVESGFMMC